MKFLISVSERIQEICLSYFKYFNYVILFLVVLCWERLRRTFMHVFMCMYTCVFMLIYVCIYMSIKHVSAVMYICVTMWACMCGCICMYISDFLMFSRKDTINLSQNHCVLLCLICDYVAKPFSTIHVDYKEKLLFF